MSKRIYPVRDKHGVPMFERRTAEVLNLHRELFLRALRARRELPHVARAIELPKCPVEFEGLKAMESAWRKEFERRA